MKHSTASGTSHAVISIGKHATVFQAEVYVIQACVHETKPEDWLGKYFSFNKKVQLDATICRHLFTAKSLYMFRTSQHPSPGALKTVTATSGIGHNTGTAPSFQRGLLRTGHVGRK